MEIFDEILILIKNFMIYLYFVNMDGVREIVITKDKQMVVIITAGSQVRRSSKKKINACFKILTLSLYLLVYSTR